MFKLPEVRPLTSRTVTLCHVFSGKMVLQHVNTELMLAVQGFAVFFFACLFCRKNKTTSFEVKPFSKVTVISQNGTVIY